jgi:protein SCO1/2
MVNWSQAEACYEAVLMVARFAFALFLVAALTACGRQAGWHATNVEGAMPALEFRMVRANDGAQVSARDYAGKTVLLYFGYTQCPDICPTTLANLSEALHRLGPLAQTMRVLFVTVDPDRDTLPVLKEYVGAFAPQIDGLRGDDDAIAALARRYRVAYGVEKGTGARDYRVMHSDAVFFFDREGHARLVATSTDDVEGLAADLRRLAS